MIILSNRIAKIQMMIRIFNKTAKIRTISIMDLFNKRI